MSASHRKRITVNQSNFRTASILSVIIGLLSVVASAGGLVMEELYRKNLWVTSQFRGSDLVRLLIIVPLFRDRQAIALGHHERLDSSRQERKFFP
jgi:ABC-type spermidine/putrescine transport system permease subunit II